MHIMPWQFNGLGILSTIMFVWNVVLFSIFTLISLVRMFKYPRHVKQEITSSIDEMSYLGAPAIAYLTLVSQVILTCSTAWGYGLTVFAYVLWWIGLVWIVSLCTGTVVLLAKHQITNDHQVSPSIFLPLISVMTLGTTGGLLANYSVGISSAEAVPVIVVSFCCIGYALFLSLLYYAIFMHRLMVAGLPQKPKLPSLVITVGPLRQFATAIQVLGTAASTGRHFANSNEGTWLTASAAASVQAACELIALLIMGFAFLWISVAWYLVIEALILRRLPVSMTWWSLIFPMVLYLGVFTTSLSNLSIALDSPAFRGLTAALLIFLLIIYFVNLACTFRLFRSEQHYPDYQNERMGCFANVNRTVRLSHEAVDPPGEPRLDLNLFLMYAKRMGFKDKDGNDLRLWMQSEEILNAWKQLSKEHPCDYSAMTYKKLSGSTGIQWPCNEEISLSTGRRVQHFYTRTKTGRTQPQKVCPEPEIVILEDVTSVGVKDGDEVLVQSMRGQVQLPMRVGDIENEQAYMGSRLKQPNFKSSATKISKVPPVPAGEVVIHAREKQTSAEERSYQKRHVELDKEVPRQRQLERWLGEFVAAINRFVDIYTQLVPRLIHENEIQAGPCRRCKGGTHI
ncbi:ATPase [Curvularia clavata]|uniref:ATPase n=1 Tax=Curvularia clavata TaxID=95742 RepID=A0A9Q8Z2J7_CURCL|nr:ATPase [Curvularia clavata]